MNSQNWSDILEGLVFDLDGVLVFSRDSHRRAFEEIFAELGIHNFHYDGFAGWPPLPMFSEQY